MFIDINTYVGHWPFRQLVNNTLASLDKLAQDNGITHMVVSNVEGLFLKDCIDANYKLLDELKAYTGKTVFLPLAIVNPTYPEWELDARAMIDAGFMGFEISPTYHMYGFGPELPFDSYTAVHYAGQVLKLAKELDVPVRFCSSFENFRARSNHESHSNPSGADLRALMAGDPDTHLLLTSVHAGSVADAAKARPNTYFDITAVTASAINTPSCEGLVSAVSGDQICFGSLAPFQYIEAPLVCMEYSVIDADKAKVNAARAFKSLR